jgi:hypothetical protein
MEDEKEEQKEEQPVKDATFDVEKLPEKKDQSPILEGEPV